MGATITRMDVVDKILITCTGACHPDQGGYDPKPGGDRPSPWDRTLRHRGP